MNELKKFYIAPEVELLCFEPVENLANDHWLWSLDSNGSGETPDIDGSNVEIVYPDGGGETTSPTLNPDGEW